MVSDVELLSQPCEACRSPTHQRPVHQRTVDWEGVDG